MAREPRTGFVVRWNVIYANGRMPLSLEFDHGGPVDRERVLSKLDKTLGSSIRWVAIHLSGRLSVHAGYSDDTTMEAWNRAVAVVQGLRKILRYEQRVERGSARTRLPLGLRVGSLTYEDANDLAFTRNWIAPYYGESVGGLSGAVPLDRWPNRLAMIYLAGDSTSGRSFAQNRWLHLLPSWSFGRIATEARKRAIEQELPGWNFYWDRDANNLTHGDARWLLDLSKKMTLGEIADRVEREANRIDPLLARYSGQVRATRNPAGFEN